MNTMSESLALDIETTGLDPLSNRVVGVAVVTPSGTTSKVFDSERVILVWLEDVIRKAPPEAIILTWNGEEFDLPFLAARYAANELPTALELRIKEGTGKYGGAVFDASWGDREHVDIAPLFEPIADELGVQWSLKPVSRAVLNVDPVEVDRRGEAIATMSNDHLREYVESDAEITFKLAGWLRATHGVLSGHQRSGSQPV